MIASNCFTAVKPWFTSGPALAVAPAARLRAQILVLRRAVERRDVIAQILDEIRVMPQLNERRLHCLRCICKRRRVCHQCRIIVVGRQAKLLQNLRRVLRRRNRTGRLVDAPQFRQQQLPLDALARGALMEIARAARLIARRLRQACDHPCALAATVGGAAAMSVAFCVPNPLTRVNMSSPTISLCFIVLFLLTLLFPDPRARHTTTLL